MRGRMSDAPSYAAPVVIGEVMVGGTVSRVEASQHPGYQPGDLVGGYTGWQAYAISDGTRLSKLVLRCFMWVDKKDRDCPRGGK